MKCEIVKDLLPSYIDGLTSKESNEEIEEHLKTCTGCQEALDKMKAEVEGEGRDYSKEIKPLKKLNKRALKAVLITLAACVAMVGIYCYFFAVGWRVDSEDMKIHYSYDKDSIQVNFELTNGRMLTEWRSRSSDRPLQGNFSFRECFDSPLDDIGNEFSYGTNYMNKDGTKRVFTDEDYFIIRFKDKTETLYWKDIQEELGIE